MRIWLDVHLSPAVGRWICQTFGVEWAMLRDMGMQRTDDDDAFEAARLTNVDAVMTEDVDWVRLVERLGRPPSVIRLTCGNCSNLHLRAILAVMLPYAFDLVQAGEPLIEIGDIP